MKNTVFAVLVTLIILLFPTVSLASSPQASPPPIPNLDDIELTVELQGLDNLFVGVEARGRVLFQLDGAQFAQEIYYWDFWAGNLPPGLFAEEPRRINSQLVEIRITGEPAFATSMNRNISTPFSIPVRNIRHGQLLPTNSLRAVREGSFLAGATSRSADVSPWFFTFDLNPHSSQHRDMFVYVRIFDDYRLTGIRYGRMTLREETDFVRYRHDRFRINTSFLERLAVGEWDLEFVMNRGANPVVTMRIIDSRRIELPDPYEPVGPPPWAPEAPPHPDVGFMFLTGGVAVDLNSLHWGLNRARVAPEFHSGVATATVRADVLNNLAQTRPGDSFQIMTPFARINIPTNIFDLTFGARAAVSRNNLAYSQVDFRITVTDRTSDPRFAQMLTATHPNGELLTSLIEVRVELINTQTGAVILTAQEFSRPIEINFVVMDNAGHLRPAGVLFQLQWIEFVPNRTASPNEFTLSTIFPGTLGVIHNRAHFRDVYTTHWGFLQSYTAAYSGLLLPMDNLQPYTPISRGEFAQLLSSTLQLPRATAHRSGFADVPPSNAFFDGVSRLFEAGLLGPYVSGSYFYPNAIITREEMAAIIGMAIRLNSPTAAPRHAGTFADARDFNPHHIANVQLAVNFGVMAGYPDNTFRPGLPSTRIYALEATINLARLLGVIDEI
ncbi:MAG: S-layer homology domain-containing protein [Defluviitaleaceae bacterium]|nr:S-layer homology domain-containing protein [Defluviitaleaceae bacterium]